METPITVIVVFGDKQKMFNVTPNVTFRHLLDHCLRDKIGFELVSCKGVAFESDTYVMESIRSPYLAKSSD